MSCCYICFFGLIGSRRLPGTWGILVTKWGYQLMIIVSLLLTVSFLSESS